MSSSFRANPSSPAASALSRCKWANMSARCDDTRNESSAAREICDAGRATERAAMRCMPNAKESRTAKKAELSPTGVFQKCPWPSYEIAISRLRNST